MKHIDWRVLDETAREEALARPELSRGDTLRATVAGIVVAVRAQKTLIWNGLEMRAENVPETESFIKARYRKGWV